MVTRVLPAGTRTTTGSWRFRPVTILVVPRLPESAASCARARLREAGSLQLGVKSRIPPPSLFSHACELFSTSPQVIVNRLPIGEVESEGSKHLFQAERRKGLRNAFRRFAP